MCLLCVSIRFECNLLPNAVTKVQCTFQVLILFLIRYHYNYCVCTVSIASQRVEYIEHTWHWLLHYHLLSSSIYRTQLIQTR